LVKRLLHLLRLLNRQALTTIPLTLDGKYATIP
jgi:hypothetical protein